MTASPPARAGEPLDALLWRAIAGGPAAVERTLEANPGLAETAGALPEGTVVEIPAAAAAPAAVDIVQLWS